MHINQLSQKTYEAIIVESEKISDVINLNFIMLAYQCRDEEEFIIASKELTDEMLRYNKYDLNNIFFGEPPTKEKFQAALKKIINNIKTLESTI